LSTKTWNVGRSILFTGVALAAALLVNQLVGCMSAPAQERGRAYSVGAQDNPATADELIRQMAQSASIIFVGEVLEVRRPVGAAGSSEDAAEGVVEVDFRVDQPVLGVQGNSAYTLREWSGLWAGGMERYRSGQRLLMLLRAPNAAGLTSPVHGSEGAIPLRGIAPSPGPDDSASTAPHPTPAQWMVDLRWLQAQTMRPQVQITAPPRGPLPVRGGGRFHSEAAQPLMVRAFPGPWMDSVGTVPQVESLSHVLSLCAPGEPQDAQ